MLVEQIGPNNTLIYQVNAGNTYFAPWLASIAVGYEKYKINNISLDYCSTCSATAEGYIVIAYDTDPADVTTASGLSFTELSNFKYRK